MIFFRKKRTEKILSKFDILQNKDVAVVDYYESSHYNKKKAIEIIDINSGTYIEKRLNIRKETNFSGGYISEFRELRGLISIKNISLTGMKCKLNTQRQLYLDDILIVKFNLEDIVNSLVSRDVIVRNLDGMYVGVEFCNPEINDGLKLFLGDFPGEAIEDKQVVMSA